MSYQSWAPDDLRAASEGAPRRLSVEATIAQEQKSIGKAYLLWFFFGSAGGHNYYLGKPIHGLLQFAANVIAILSSLTDIWPLTAIFSGALILSLIVDLCMIPARVAAHTERLHEQLSDRLTWSGD